jgi:hypothetical protein
MFQKIKEKFTLAYCSQPQGKVQIIFGCCAFEEMTDTLEPTYVSSSACELEILTPYHSSEYFQCKICHFASSLSCPEVEGRTKSLENNCERKNMKK